MIEVVTGLTRYLQDTKYTGFFLRPSAPLSHLSAFSPYSTLPLLRLDPPIFFLLLLPPFLASPTDISFFSFPSNPDPSTPFLFPSSSPQLIALPSLIFASHLFSFPPSTSPTHPHTVKNQYPVLVRVIMLFYENHSFFHSNIEVNEGNNCSSYCGEV